MNGVSNSIWNGTFFSPKHATSINVLCPFVRILPAPDEERIDDVGSDGLDTERSSKDTNSSHVG